MATAKQWLDSTNGKKIDADGAYGAQCVDLIKDYFPKVLGIPAIRNNAKDYWTNYPTAHLTRIQNTASFVPKRGDIAVWGTGVGQYGHIAVCEGEGNVNWFVSLDQNWPFSDGTTPAKYIRHTYSGFLGVLRPKKDVNFDQAAYNAAVRAQQEAARIAKEAEDARVAAEAAKVSAAAKAEADRLAAEQAAADQKAKEEAAAVKAEQARLAAEQARLEAEVAAQKQAQKASFLDALVKLIKEIFNFYKE
jgi:hypothetical protein